MISRAQVAAREQELGLACFASTNGERLMAATHVGVDGQVAMVTGRTRAVTWVVQSLDNPNYLLVGEESVHGGRMAAYRRALRAVRSLGCIVRVRPKKRAA